MDKVDLSIEELPGFLAGYLKEGKANIELTPAELHQLVRLLSYNLCIVNRDCSNSKHLLHIICKQIANINLSFESAYDRQVKENRQKAEEKKKEKAKKLPWESLLFRAYSKVFF